MRRKSVRVNIALHTFHSHFDRINCVRCNNGIDIKIPDCEKCTYDSYDKCDECYAYDEAIKNKKFQHKNCTCNILRTSAFNKTQFNKIIFTNRTIRKPFGCHLEHKRCSMHYSRQSKREHSRKYRYENIRENIYEDLYY